MPSREAHSRRASGPLAALAQTDPKFHPGWSLRNWVRSSSTALVYYRIRPYTALLAGLRCLSTLHIVIMREGPTAPWRQIAEIFRGRIASGELAPGDRLPSIASISQEYGVAMTTAQKVIVALRDEGLAVTSPMGTFVSPPS